MSTPGQPSSSRLAASERHQLTPFVVGGEEAGPRDQRDLMERPFFSLAKGRRTAPILYRAGDVEVQVLGFPEHGMATIWDADVLIWAASQLVEAADARRPTSRFLRFTPYQLLTAIGRPTGRQQYRLLKAALQRLQSTVVATSIRQGPSWRRRQFSWINEWEETADRTGRALGMELVLPEWLYRSVLDRSLVLTIDPAYFRLTGGIERWLYRVARKHAGAQQAGWSFEVRHLHTKSGSLARLSDFALDVRRIAARQSLPGYRVRLVTAGGVELLQVRPDLSPGTMDKHLNGTGRSGARTIGISGARLSAYQAHESQLTLWPSVESGARNLSNHESNSSDDGSGAGAHRHHGTVTRRRR